ncbi:MAG: acetate kinase [Acholeplasmataceae bacterium]|jgi:acetate kinase|nr:acetate kinase [Acholeplasmataceae bacterium]MDD4824517.1 acetate kinase [Acholeplasmataceae bacterium]
MKIMSVNSGSSSIKFQLFDMPEERVVSSGQIEKIGFTDAIATIKFNGDKQQRILPIKDHVAGVKEIIDSLIKFGVLDDMSEIKGVGHRIVQGGEYFKASTLVTPEALEKIIEYADMAPLHNIPHAVTIKGFQAILPNVPHVAVFDTTFHQTMAEDAYMYATPYEWYTDYGVRRYGFHGTSHKYISQEVNKLLGRTDTKVIVCHIGNGASISAVKNGVCVDTSMGFTPLEGIPMGTRTGSIDPAILNFMEHKLNVDSDEMNVILNKKSGYLGISGLTSDARDLETAIEKGHKRAKLAFDLQAKRIADYIGSYYVYMGGLDAIAFTAGIGENSPGLRKLVLDRLEVLGVKMDETLNNTRGAEVITTEDSKVKVFVLKTDEEVMIARDTLAFVK